MVYCLAERTSKDETGNNLFPSKGSFTLAKFVSKTVTDSDTQQSLLYLPWPHWAVQNKIEMILFCVALPKVAKASIIVTVECHCCQCVHLKNIAIGNTS